jgi:hypothetical protein
MCRCSSRKGSNALERRPQLRAALELWPRRKVSLVIAKLDRLARNVHFVSGLIESGVDFVAADLPRANKVMIHMHAVMSELERDQISECTNHPAENNHTPLSWFGVAGGATEVGELVRDGWPEGVQRNEQAFGQIEVPPVQSMRRKKTWGPSGYAIDMLPVYRGNPGAWSSHRRRRAPGGSRFITIRVVGSEGFSARADTLFWRGAAALALIDALEHAGYNVRVVAQHSTSMLDGASMS